MTFHWKDSYLNYRLLKKHDVHSGCASIKDCETLSFPGSTEFQQEHASELSDLVERFVVGFEIADEYEFSGTRQRD